LYQLDGDIKFTIGNAISPAGGVMLPLSINLTYIVTKALSPPVFTVNVIDLSPVPLVSDIFLSSNVEAEIVHVATFTKSPDISNSLFLFEYILTRIPVSVVT
jgi:hypothetical protein